MENYRYKRYINTNQETRWATEDEIRNSSTYIHLNDTEYPAAGLPLLSDGKNAYVDAEDTHSLIFGATGSKKTRLFCMPMLGMFIRAGESFIATDPKGELYRRTSGMAKAYGYRTVVLNFRDIGKGDLWNPLALPYRMYKAGDKESATVLLNDFVGTLSAKQFETTHDIFWPEMASSYAIANLLLLMECADESEANVSSLARLCSDDMKEKLKLLSEQMSPYSIAGMNYKNVLTSPEKTLQSIFASLYAMIRVFNIQKDLSIMLSGNTIDLSKIGREKTALYIIVPDEKTTVHFLVTTFLKQAYEILIREAQREMNGMLPVRVNFVLDEFCNIPKIPDMASMISAGRSRNIRYFLIVQSKHQLIGRYQEDADTIKGNCENWVFLTSKELDLLEEISALCGTTVTSQNQHRRLISVSELQRLNKEKGEALIMHARQYPIITEIADIDMYEMFKGYPPLPLKNNRGGAFRIFSLDDYYNKVLRGIKPIPFVNGD
ncbi:MAG: type IV secretory system conjugative DNA transfer family protein [Eubacteriales bacterium]|nr:type IV secretory system conjugative DNA transfer family protein [Eubacteriales bacterium]